MQKTKKWQLPVLIIGVVLLAYFGIHMVKTFRAAGGSAATGVSAKAPEHVKPEEPVSEATTTTPTPAPTAPTEPAAGGKTPVEELAAIDLPAGDILRPLDAVPPQAGSEGTGEEGPVPELPTMIGPLPRATLVAGPGGPEAAPRAPRGIGNRVRRGGPGYPMILPERTEKEESIRCLGTITGQRRIAILRDLSATTGRGVLFVAEGDRIPGPKGLVVSRVEPGSVTIHTGIASTRLQVKPESDEAGGTGARGRVSPASLRR